MEDIIIHQLLIAITEEGSLWDLYCEINTMFPENTTEKNLSIAIEGASWLRDTKKLTFYSKNAAREKLILEDVNFLLNPNNWKPTIELYDIIWTMLTDLGDDYYNEFEEKFWSYIATNGFLRQGEKYNVSRTVFDKIKLGLVLGDLFRVLGIPPTIIDNNLVKHTDLFSHTQCIVDIRTSLITDISSIEN